MDIIIFKSFYIHGYRRCSRLYAITQGNTPRLPKRRHTHTAEEEKNTTPTTRNDFD